MNAETNPEVNKYLEMRDNLEIVARKPKIGPFDDLPEYWADGHRGLTMAQNIFSMTIPEGEKFFVRSVMRVKNKIKDPQLLEDIQNFARQEAYHSKAHIDFNDALRKYHYPVDDVTKRVRVLFKIIETVFPAKIGLGVTAFLEHLTALGAESAFRFEELQEDWPKEAKEFWEWHAIEEMEHKSVAFDVLEAIGGGFWTRMASVAVFAVMAFLMVVFVVIPATFYRERIKGIPGPGRTPSSVTMKELSARHPGKWKALSEFSKSYFFDYFRKDFHPWEKEHADIIEKWRAERPEWSKADWNS